MVDEIGDGHPWSRFLSQSAHVANADSLADRTCARAQDDLCLVLARTIERDVIPRLLLNTRLETGRRDAVRAMIALQASRDVTEFCHILLDGAPHDADAYVADKIASGTALENLLLVLLAPTARRLGHLWDSDACTFAEVTIALGRLLQLLRFFSDADRPLPDPAKPGYRALLATAPSSQHIFGIVIVEELFRRAGWNVRSLLSPRRSALLAAVQRDWFAVVGLSISCDREAGAIASLIEDVREASLNQSILVLVGGCYITDHPERALLLGADLAGIDVLDTIETSQTFVRSVAS